MSMQFNGRVAIVTGAGGGLGRQYALALGQRGASVVVNDLGGDPHGKGQSARAADTVVNEIRAAGGKAVANYDSVEDGEKIVQTAIQSFGRIDILINNAGILRDKSFARISNDDWDLIHRVHLRGSFMVTRAAWPHMKDNKFGRIIMTSSAAGLYGNFGQANYSAAKMGLLGMSNTLAIEGKNYNIHCNTIAPIAGSRLTATVMPPDLLDQLKPEYVAPLVLFLCHESCIETGGCYEVGAGWVGKMRWEETRGATIDQMTPEAVRDKWHKITDFTGSRNPSTIQESTGNFVSILQESGSGSGAGDNSSSHTPLPNAKGVEKMIGRKISPSDFEYSSRDVILYALGVGMSTQEKDHLSFLFEGSEGFAALPGFGVIPAQMAFMTLFTSSEGVDIDPTKILHGEQYMELKSALPVSGKLTSNVMISDAMDKGKGAVLLVDVETCGPDGQVIVCNQFAIYISGAGGYGGKRTSLLQIPVADIPQNSKPDAVVEEKTGLDQAALYRLNGDYNPLHIDPGFAAMGGMPQPILHGLCTFGIASRHVLRTYANNDVTKFKAIKVRFSKPVIPGQTVQTEMWKRGNRIHIQCRVKESGEVCLSSGYVDLHSVADTSASSSVTNNESETLASDKVFLEIGRRVSTDPGLIKSVKAIYLWNIKKDGQIVAKWTLDLKNGSGSVYRGEPTSGKADCILELSDEDMVGLVTGKLNPQKAFMAGKLKVKGNIMLSQKLSSILKDKAKL